MKGLLAALAGLLWASCAAAQVGSYVQEETWQATVRFTGSDGRQFDAPKNYGVSKVYLAGVLVQQWGAAPAIGDPTPGFVSTYGGSPVSFSGVVAAVKILDLKTRP